jgi:hypothetical protein
MPTDRIPLVGSFNQRGLAGNADLVSGLDQRFLNCVFSVAQNPVTEKAVVYVEKRPGWGVDSLVAAGSASTAFLRPQSFNAAIAAFGDTNSTIYVGTISVGAITGRALFFTETIVNSITYVMIKSSDGTGWFYAEGAKDQLTYIGDTHTNTTIDNIASTAGMYVGQIVTGTNIPADTRIATVSATSITLTQATTGTTAGITITKAPLAKIIDADFVTTGTRISAFVEMDGYLFYSTDDGNVRNSDLNSVTSYPALGYVSPNMSPDPPVGLARHKNLLIAMGCASKEAFYNAGLATGSPLQRSPQYFDRIGALDQRSIVTLDNDIYFASTPHEGDVGVHRIRGMELTKVSTFAVDKILGTAAADGAIYATSFRLGGYPYAAFVVSVASDGPASNLLLESGDALLLESGDNILLEDTPAQVASFLRMLVLNASLGVWSEWDCNQATFVDGIGMGTSNQILATSRFNTGGKIYRIAPISDGQLYTDEGAAFSMEIRTARVDHGTTKRKFVQSVRLVSDQQTAGTASLYFSDDNYVTWQGPFTFDMELPEPRVNRLGSYEGGRAYKIVHSYNGPFRAEALEIDYTVAK